MSPCISPCRPIEPGRRAGGPWAAALVLLLEVGCGPAEPLLVGVEEAAVIAPDRLESWGTVLRVQVRLENRGDAPVHVFTDLLQVLGEDGSRGTVREFRDRYRIQQARVGDEERRRSFEAMFAGVGIQGDHVRELVQAQIEVPPGQTLQRTLPFLLKGDKPDARYAMDFVYHDNATDRITRLNLPVRTK